jgi:hypothetical protein
MLTAVLKASPRQVKKETSTIELLLTQPVEILLHLISS